jgi:O-antigen/teichoic acid export membrane protein
MKKIRLLINSLSLLSNRLIQGISTFALTTVIARNLGADKLGQYVLAIGFYYIFVTFFGLGLRTLFTRELSRKPDNPGTYLVSGSLLQFGLSIFAYFGLVTVVFLMPYSAETSRVCYIMGLSVIPFALSNITEAIFQARERMHSIVMTTSPVYILRLLVSMWVVWNMSFPIERVAAIMVVSEFIIWGLQWWVLTRTVKPNWKIDRPFIADSFMSARTLFAIDGAGIIAGKLDILFLSLLAGQGQGELMVGIYGAIRQLMQPFEIITSSLISALFPRMSQAVFYGRQKQRDIEEGFLDILFCISLPLIPTIFFFYGQEILVAMYKNPEFARGDLALKIIMLSVVLYPLIRLCNYILIVNKLEKYNLIEVAITTTFSGIVGIFLISRYQLVGAGCMMVAMSCCSSGVLLFFIRTKLFRLRWLKVLRRPAILTVAMLAFLSVLEQFKLNLAIDLIVALGFYATIAASMSIHHLGGMGAIAQLTGRKAPPALAPGRDE